MIIVNNITTQFCKILLITALCLSTSWVHARTPDNLAIQGYSPVSYFEKNKAEMGSAEFNVLYQGKTYWFTSADQVRTFNINPTQYLPISDAFCAYSLTLGHTVPIDPTNFKIVAGQLLLFHQSDAGDGLIKWNHSDNEEELLRRAKSTLLSLEF